MKKTVIVKTGDTFPDVVKAHGDFEQLIASGLGLGSQDLLVVNVTENSAEISGPHENMPDLAAVNGVVISGSHAMVTQDLDWSLALEAWVRELIETGIPLLGICYGHQLIARAMGGTVDFHPRGLEIGTVGVTCLDEAFADPLFKDLPPCFKAHAFHSQSVIHLPSSAVVLARNDFEPHHAFRIGTAAWGVQFHPEADKGVTQGYIENLAGDVRLSGQDPDVLIRDLDHTPHASSILKAFGEFARSR